MREEPDRELRQAMKATGPEGLWPRGPCHTPRIKCHEALGKVMQAVVSEHGDVVDGRTVNQIAREVLGRSE